MEPWQLRNVNFGDRRFIKAFRPVLYFCVVPRPGRVHFLEIDSDNFYGNFYAFMNRISQNRDKILARPTAHLLKPNC